MFHCYHYDETFAILMKRFSIFCASGRQSQPLFGANEKGWLCLDSTREGQEVWAEERNNLNRCRKITLHMTEIPTDGYRDGMRDMYTKPEDKLYRIPITLQRKV